MTSFQGRFRLDRAAAPRSSVSSPSDSSGVPAPSAPTFAYIDFRVHPDPTPPKPAIGCFEHDSASSKFGLRWDRWTDFQAWLITEQETHGIELRLVNTYPPTPAFQRACRYVCSRKGTGGIKPYTKIHPDWNRKRGTKRTDCKCTLLVKEYPGIATILGSYADQHDHPLGNANLPFTQIPKHTREYIAGLLRQRVAPDRILQLLHGGIYDHDDLFDRDHDGTQVATRSEFIQLSDIRRIEKQIEAEAVRLHPDDGISTLRWVENLRAKGHLLGFKSKADPPPPGSNLALDEFVLMIQTEWQRKMFRKYGEPLLCVDATHNVT
ncbi:hypothetical protein B0H15DRAFT_788380, partial [Mycena belliarum]